jgi:outer membrane receptor protein involved in Fe transport
VTNSIVAFKDPVTLVSQYRNAGSSRYTGLELSADYRVNQNWLINLGYTLEDAKFVNYKALSGATLIDYSGKNIPNVPVSNAVLTLQYNLGGFTANLVNRYNSGSFPGSDNVVFYNGHILTDLTFSWNKPDYEFYISGRNIFNNRYIGYESASGTNESILPGAPVSVMVGMTYKF